MKKKLLAIVLTLAMLVSMVPVTAMAAGGPLNIGLSVSVEGKTGNYVEAGDTITASITVPAGDYSAAQAGLTFDKTRLEVTNIKNGFVPRAKEDVDDNGDPLLSAGWSNVNVTKASTANANGSVVAVAVGNVVNSLDQVLEIGNVNMAEPWNILTVTFTVKEDAPLDKTEIALIAEGTGAAKFTYEDDGEVVYDRTLANPRTLYVVEYVTEVEITAEQLPAPTLGGKVVTSFSTADNHKVSVTWTRDGEPFTGDKFTNGTFVGTVRIKSAEAYGLFNENTMLLLDGAEIDFTVESGGNEMVFTINTTVSADQYMPSITVQPKSATYVYGDAPVALTVSATANGGELSYQWYKDGAKIDGATSASYTPELKAFGTAEYCCEVTNNVNGVPVVATSNIAVITYQQKTITTNMVEDATASSEYTGKEISPELVLKNGEVTLIKDVDYTLSGDLVKTDVGVYTYTITGIGNYTGTVEMTWLITEAEIITDGTLAMTVYMNGQTFTVGSDVLKITTVGGCEYTVTYALKSGDCLTITPEGTITPKALGDAVITATIEAPNHKTKTVDIAVKVADKINASGNMTFESVKTETVYDGAEHALSEFVNAASCDLEGTITYLLDGKEATLASTIRDAGSYTITAVFENDTYYGTKSVTITVSPKIVSVVWSNTELTYNGTEQAPTATVEGEELVITVSGGQTNAGEGYTATAATENGNYALENTTCTYTIAPKTLTIDNVMAGSKPYDGTTNGGHLYAGNDETPEGANLVGVIEGDDVKVDDTQATATFAGFDVGEWEVTFAGFALTGADAANYELTQPAPSTGSIIPRPVTIIGLGAEDKVYDGTTDVVITGTAAIDNMVEGDTLTVKAGTAAFADANVGTGITVNFSGYALEGADAHNYELVEQPASVEADISAADLKANESPKMTVYNNGNTYTIGSDVLDVVTVDGCQYTVAYAVKSGSEYLSVAEGVITPKAVGEAVITATITAPNHNTLKVDIAVTVSAKQDAGQYMTFESIKTETVYDGAEHALSEFVNAASCTLEGTITYLLNGQEATLETLIKNAGTYEITAIFENEEYYGAKTVTVTVAVKAVTITGLTAADKSYDGTTDVVLAGTAVLDGMVEGDDVTIKAGTASFADANAGVDKTVTFTGYALEGADAANYELTGQPASVTADITPAVVTVELTGMQEIKVGSGLSAIYIDDNIVVEGVNGEIVEGEIKWYRDETCTDPATDTDISTLEIGDIVTLCWAFETANTNYDAASAKGETDFVIVEGDPQKVSFQNDTVEKTYGDADFTNPVFVKTLDGTAITDGGAITYTSSDVNVATVDETGKVTIVGAGTATITATAASVPGVYAAGTASYTVTVAPKSVAVTWSNTALTYTGLAQKPTASATGIDGEAVAITVSGEQTKAGTYEATVVSADPNYTLTNDKVEYTIAKAVLTITGAETEGRVYEKDNKTVTVTGVTFEGLQNGETLTLGTDYTAAGEMADDKAGAEKAVTVTVTLADTELAANYEIKTTGTAKAAIEKAEAKLTYDGEDLKLIGSVVGVITVNTTNTDSNKLTFTIDGLNVVSAVAKDNTLTVSARRNGIATIYVKAPASENFKEVITVLEIKVNAIVQPVLGVTVGGENLVATLDGETVKITGVGIYDPETLAFEILDNAGVKVIVEGDTATVTIDDLPFATYTIDASAVVDPGNVTYETEAPTVESETGIPEKEKVEDVETSNLVGSFADDMKESADAAEAEAEEGADVVVSVTLEVTQEPTKGDELLKLEIAPVITVTVNEEPVSQEKVSQTSAPVTVIITVPEAVWNLPDLFIKHFCEDGSVEYLPVTKLEGNRISWQQSSFSGVELHTNATKTVTFQFADGSTQTTVYDYTDIGVKLPTDSKSGYNFKGWVIGGKTYTTLTEEAFLALNEEGDILEGSFATIWVAPSVSYYVVKFNTNGGSDLPNKSFAEGTEVDLTKYVPTKEGYLFAGWFTDEAFTQPVTKITVIGDVTVHARWKLADPFQDVMDKAAYYYDPVMWAYLNDITAGATDTLFKPDALCTRAQAVTFLWRAAGQPEPQGKAPFEDVVDTEYYAKAVAWAYENEITNGATDTLFKPNATVNRAQFVTFLWRYAGKPAAEGTPAFTDVPADAYYAGAVAWANENGIVLGLSDTVFGGDDPCVRGQTVTFLYRYFN